jgi:hypothetical protein
MSIKIKRLLAVAAAMLVGGLGATLTPTASAATPSCGHSCINVFPRLYGSGFVLDVLNQNEGIGQPIVLAPASNTNPGEDFTVSFQGLVSDFIAAGLVSPALSAYDNLQAVEFEYAPFGVDSGLCVGVGAAPTNHTPVALESCGVTAKTVWIENPDQSITGANLSLINAATDNSFSHPYVLTDLRPDQGQLFTWPLDGGGILHNRFANQWWGASFGPVR